MANTYKDYTATADQAVFPFTFPYLKDTHVIVSVDGTEYDKGDGYFTIETSPIQVRLTDGLSGGQAVRIKRNSLGKDNAEEEPLVDYTDGSVLTEKELDDAYLHNFYLSQEAVEGAAGGMSLDSTQTNWDAENKKIVNVGDPTDNKDAINKEWVLANVSDKITGSNTAAQKWTFTGDNSATAFTFSPTIDLNADTAYTVAIDGVLQEPTVAYAIDSDADTITFTSAPPTSSNIVVIARGYSVPVTSGEGTVTSVTAGNGLDGGEITTTGTVSIPTSGGTLNIDSGKVGIGGDADSAYHTKLTGDVLIEDTDTASAVLTLKNTSTTATATSVVVVEAPMPVVQYTDTVAGTNEKYFYQYLDGGAFILYSANDDASLRKTLYTMYSDGNIKLDSLPTTDPSTTGYLWNDGGVVRVSGSTGVTLSELPTDDPGATGELWNDGGVVSVSGSSGFSGGGGSTLTLATKQTFTSSSTDTACEFTSIPSGVKQITIIFDDFGFSTSLAETYLQLGDSGGYETSGYSYSYGTAYTTSGAGGGGGSSAGNFQLTESYAAVSGLIKLERIDANIWVLAGTIGKTTAGVTVVSGRKALSGTLDRLRIFGYSTGPNWTLASGSINISYI